MTLPLVSILLPNLEPVSLHLYVYTHTSALLFCTSILYAHIVLLFVFHLRILPGSYIYTRIGDI